MTVELPIPIERLNPKSISDRFWGNDPKQNFFARAKNLVITGNLDRNLLLEIQNEYDGDLVADFTIQWKELLEEITFHITVDGVVDPEEKVFFKEYIAIFQIAKDEASRIYRTGARRACLKLLQHAYIDDRVDEKELERVQKIALNFGLREFDVQAHRTVQVEKLIQARFEDMTSDLMISDHEWETFEAYCKDMRVNLSNIPEFQKIVGRGRKLWAAKYGAIQPIAVQQIKLKKNELVYLYAQANWYEMRMERGEPYRKLIRSGELYLTDKRVVMVSDDGDNKSIKWDAIHRVVEHSSAGFELEKITGKSPTILITNAGDITWLTATSIAHRLCHGQV